jgi:thiol-disulfide isomerase/thioredoxin
MKLKITNSLPVLAYLLLTLLLQSVVVQAQNPLFKLDENGNPIMTEEVVNEIVATAKFKTLDEESTFLNRIFGESEFLRITDFEGKIVILDFWQTWCSPCLASFKGFQKAKETWPDKIEIIAASPDWADSQGKIRRFINKHDYNFNFVLAHDLEKELNLSSIPYKIIIAPDGTLIKSVSDSKGAEGEFKEIEKLIDTWFLESQS